MIQYILKPSLLPNSRSPISRSRVFLLSFIFRCDLVLRWTKYLRLIIYIYMPTGTLSSSSVKYFLRQAYVQNMLTVLSLVCPLYLFFFFFMILSLSTTDRLWNFGIAFVVQSRSKGSVFPAYSTIISKQRVMNFKSSHLFRFSQWTATDRVAWSRWTRLASANFLNCSYVAGNRRNLNH